MVVFAENPTAELKSWLHGIFQQFWNNFVVTKHLICYLLCLHNVSHECSFILYGCVKVSSNAQKPYRTCYIVILWLMFVLGNQRMFHWTVWGWATIWTFWLWQSWCLFPYWSTNTGWVSSSLYILLLTTTKLCDV